MRQILWANVHTIINQGLPTIIVEDFHCIENSYEKIDGKPFNHTIGVRKICYFISSNDLSTLDYLDTLYLV